MPEAGYWFYEGGSHKYKKQMVVELKELGTIYTETRRKGPNHTFQPGGDRLSGNPNRQGIDPSA